MKTFVLLLIAYLWIPLTSHSAELDWDNLVLTARTQAPDIVVQYCANADEELILLVISKGPEGSSLMHGGPVRMNGKMIRGRGAYIETAGKIHPAPTTQENFAYVENGVVHRGRVKLKKVDLNAYVQGYLAGIEKGKP